MTVQAWARSIRRADNPDVMSVGASTIYEAFAQSGFNGVANGLFKSDQVKDWSNRGPTASGNMKPDIMAPGAFGWSDAPEPEDFEMFGGTSMATPVLAGGAALVELAYMLAHPGRTMDPVALENLLATTANSSATAPTCRAAAA